MELPVNPSQMIDLLRAWFFAKDRSIIMADNTFIEAEDNATDPADPIANRNRLFYQLANPRPGHGLYSLNSDGAKYQFSGDIASWQNAVSMFQNIPGLVGFWPMSSVQRSTGNAYDLSGQNRILTYNGNPIYNIYNGLVSYIDLDGTGDYLSRADETDLDVLGTETIYASAMRGLTLGGWFWIDTPGGSSEMLIGKWDGNGNNRSYLLSYNGGATAIRMDISANGIAGTAYDSSVSVSTAAWMFIVGRCYVGTSMDIFVNGAFDKSGSAPAGIFNGAANFEIGANNAGQNLLDGRATLCFLSANALPDSFINALFQQSRLLFGV